MNLTDLEKEEKREKGYWGLIIKHQNEIMDALGLDLEDIEAMGGPFEFEKYLYGDAIDNENAPGFWTGKFGIGTAMRENTSVVRTKDLIAWRKEIVFGLQIRVHRAKSAAELREIKSVCNYIDKLWAVQSGMRPYTRTWRYLRDLVQQKEEEHRLSQIDAVFPLRMKAQSGKVRIANNPAQYLAYKQEGFIKDGLV